MPREGSRRGGALDRDGGACKAADGWRKAREKRYRASYNETVDFVAKSIVSLSKKKKLNTYFEVAKFRKS